MEKVGEKSPDLSHDQLPNLVSRIVTLIPIPHHHGNAQRTGCTPHAADPGTTKPAKHTLSPPVDLPPPPTTTKLLKITMPTPFTGLQDDLDCFKAECSLYICLQGSKFPNETSQMLFILSYMKGRAAGTWATHKIQQVINPSGMPLM